jgi:hypothetical protein
MALQINGTTVVNNSRQLQNISGLDATSKGNFPFIGDVNSVTTTYTPTNTGQQVDNLESISTQISSHTTISKTTSTSMTKVVLNSTLPTFNNGEILKIASNATTSGGVMQNGYLGGYYRVWVEIGSNLVYSVIQRGSFSSQSTTAVNAMNSAASVTLTVDNTASTPTNSSSLTTTLNLQSGGKLLVEFYNYPTSNISVNGYYTFNDIDFSINVLSDVSQTFFDLGIL